MDDTATVLDAGAYRVDAASAPARLSLTGGLPADLRDMNAIAIAFTAGYGDGESDVPALIRAGILEILADLYVNRGDGAAEPPQTALSLFSPYRIFKL
jgi:uncharacterized phiE125 gp8 family phage protein